MRRCRAERTRSSQAVTAQQRAKTTEDLYAFSRKLSAIVSLDDLLWATSFQIASMLRLHVVILLPEGPSLSVRSGYPPEDLLSEADLAAAKWSWQNNRPAGRGADTLPGARRLFIPMQTGRGVVGVIGLDTERPGPLLTPDQRRLLDALAGQAALAIERIQLAADVDGPGSQPTREATHCTADFNLAESRPSAGVNSRLGNEPQVLSRAA